LLPGFVEDAKPAPSKSDTMSSPRSLIKPPEPEPGVVKVLLVEPSRTQSRIICKYLEEEHIDHVLAVGSGADALTAVRRECPTAIISAMHLADMTGVQLAQRVRAEPAIAPGFVLISSESESPEAGSLTQCGYAIALQKPFTRAKLLEALRLVSGGLKQQVNGAAKTRANARVLIVDDSAPARVHVREVLTGLGMTHFVEAADGAQAVAALVRDTFDLIVTDYNMPFMDGGGLVGYLKQNPATASVPIIMVTTEQDPLKLNAVRKLGVAICNKSFAPDIVGGLLDQVL
jgi:two-component system chemotaxis response regulator CheY